MTSLRPPNAPPPNDDSLDGNFSGTGNNSGGLGEANDMHNVPDLRETLFGEVLVARGEQLQTFTCVCVSECVCVCVCKFILIQHNITNIQTLMYTIEIFIHLANSIFNCYFF
jgi:hypothetical protein